MNAFKELVTPRNSSVPVHKSVLHHFKLPAGQVFFYMKRRTQKLTIAGTRFV